MTTDLIATDIETTTTNDNTPKATQWMNRARLVLATCLAAIVGIVGIVGVASPASAAPVQVYHTSTVNGMWHSGNTQFSGRSFVFNTYFNDRAGDQFCTQLRYKAYQSNGYATTWNGGSVCGGRTGTLGYTITAQPGTWLTKVQIWTVRADGAFGSYVWEFRP